MPAWKNADDFPHKGTLSLREAGLLCGLSPQTLRNYIKAGKLGGIYRTWRYGIYLRHAWYIPTNDFRRFLVEGVVRQVTGKRSLKWKPPSFDKE